MTKQRLLFLIGIWVAVLPFLGFPKLIRHAFFVMTGLGIILISYFMYIQVKAIDERDKKGGSLLQKESDMSAEEAPVEPAPEPVIEEEPPVVHVPADENLNVEQDDEE